MTSAKRSRRRATLGWCLGVSIAASSSHVEKIFAEESGLQLRPRTDANVQSDIAAALEWQKRWAALQQSAAGLNNIGSTPSTIASNSQSSNPATNSRIVIGAYDPADAERNREAMLREAEKSMADERASTVPSTNDTTAAVAVAATPGRIIVGDALQPLASPVVSDLSSPAASSFTNPVSIYSDGRVLRPVSAAIASNDAEAAVVPRLEGAPSTLNSGVSPAAFQAGPSMSAPPTMAAPPSSLSPSASAPVLPSSPSNVVPTTPSITGVPMMPAPSPSYPSAVSPFPSTNSAVMGPSTSSTIIGGEPFVTAAPCQFDASYMVEPANYLTASSATAGCSPTVGTTMPYTGIPGSIAPPTVMPNQVPYGLYPSGGSGFRPLLGFGQDNYNVQLGRGIIGQPVAYVDGQPLRNFLRYIFP